MVKESPEWMLTLWRDFSVVKNIETKLKFLMGVLQEMLTNSDDFIMVPFGRKRKVLKNIIRSNLMTASLLRNMSWRYIALTNLSTGLGLLAGASKEETKRQLSEVENKNP
jgi:hypothetical protein